MGKRGRPKGSGEKQTTVKFRVSDEIKEKLKKYAEKKGITMTEAIEDLIKGLPID
jgi:antitoxin component of RelBE/YafQ-DinJ toxin-antitoxin module